MIIFVRFLPFLLLEISWDLGAGEPPLVPQHQRGLKTDCGAGMLGVQRPLVA